MIYELLYIIQTSGLSLFQWQRSAFLQKTPATRLRVKETTTRRQFHKFPRRTHSICRSNAGLLWLSLYTASPRRTCVARLRLIYQCLGVQLGLIIMDTTDIAMVTTLGSWDITLKTMLAYTLITFNLQLHPLWEDDAYEKSWHFGMEPKDRWGLDSSFKSQVPCEVYTSPAGGLALCKPRNAVVDNFPPFSMATMMDIPHVWSLTNPKVSRKLRKFLYLDFK